MIVAGWMPSGLLVVTRFILPLFTKLVADLSARFVMWSALAAALLALSTLAMTSWPRRLAAYALVGSCLAFGCLWQGTDAGTSASLLLMLGLNGSAALGLLLCSGPAGDASPVDSADRRSDALNSWVVAGLWALPLTATFSGFWLLMQQSFQTGSSDTRWLLAAFVMLAWSVLDGRRLMVDARNPAVNWKTVWPVVLALLAIGIAPQFVVTRLQTATLTEAVDVD